MSRISRATLLGLTVALALFASTHVVADNAVPSVDVPAGDLKTALRLLARQTGAEIIYRSEQVKGLTTEGVRGNLSVKEALERLLKGTTLSVRTDASGAILVTTSSDPIASESGRFGPENKPPSRAPRGKSVADDPPDSTSVLEEVVVTATKRSESIQQVPLSITAVTGDALEAKNALHFDDYARSVPGVSFIDTGVGRERIAIRGIDATVGSTVVGYYIDETPIPDDSGQTLSAENVGFDPELIDVDRVEILRGPQGTVFGAGSMGGTIRIIPNAPNPDKFESTAKLDLSHISGGDGPSQIYAGMLNLPLARNRLAVRFVTWLREDPGFIERQIATPESHLANVLYGTPVDFVPVGKVPSSRAVGGRLALKLLVTESLAVEASVLSDQQLFRGYQDITTGPQNPSNALVQNFLFNTAEDNRNRMTMSSLKLTGRFSAVDLVANASYTRRLQSNLQETAAALESQGFAPMFNAAPIYEEGHDNAATAEVRLSSAQSNGEHELLQWLIGGYYSYQKGFVPARWTVPGFSQAFGSLTGPVAGDNLFSSYFVDWIKQTALFGQLDFSPIERLKLTAGARVFHLSRSDATPEAGYYGGANLATTPNAYTYPSVTGTASRAVYKGVVSWQQSKDLLFYLQAAQGFRGGFGRYALPDICAAQVQQLGFNPNQGSVAPDSLWNYEAGIKSDWADGRLRVNMDVYRIDWTNVQQSLFLDCGSSLFANAGSVRNMGGELETEARPVEPLSVGISVGYVHSALQQDIFGIPGTKGLPLPDVPKLTGGAFIEYRLPKFGQWSTAIRSDYSYTGRSLSQYGADASFAADLGALSLLGARIMLRHDNFEAALYGSNLLNNIEKTYLERDVSFEVPDRLRYSVNTPRKVGIGLSYKF